MIVALVEGIVWILSLAPIVDVSTCVPQFCLGRRQSTLLLAAPIVMWLAPIVALVLTPIPHSMLVGISLLVVPSSVSFWRESALLLVAPIEMLVAPTELWLAPIVLKGLAHVRHSWLGENSLL